MRLIFTVTNILAVIVLALGLFALDEYVSDGAQMTASIVLIGGYTWAVAYKTEKDKKDKKEE